MSTKRGQITGQVLLLRFKDSSNRRYPPEHWLKLAREAWESAWQLEDPEARHETETIACLYEELAAYTCRLSLRSERLACMAVDYDFISDSWRELMRLRDVAAKFELSNEFCLRLLETAR